jgi:hypothetical protein
MTLECHVKYVTGLVDPCNAFGPRSSSFLHIPFADASSFRNFVLVAAFPFNAKGEGENRVYPMYLALHHVRSCSYIILLSVSIKILIFLRSNDSRSKKSLAACLLLQEGSWFLLSCYSASLQSNKYDFNPGFMLSLLMIFCFAVTSSLTLFLEYTMTTFFYMTFTLVLGIFNSGGGGAEILYLMDASWCSHVWLLCKSD